MTVRFCRCKDIHLFLIYTAYVIRTEALSGELWDYDGSSYSSHSTPLQPRINPLAK